MPWKLLDETGLMPQNTICIRTATWIDINGNIILYKVTAEEIDFTTVKIIVRKWHNKSWHLVGGRPVDNSFSREAGSGNVYVTMAISAEGVIYVGYADRVNRGGGILQVRRVLPGAGETWSSNLMNVQIVTGEDPNLMIFNNDDPYLSVCDTDLNTGDPLPKVFKYNSSANTWDDTQLIPNLDSPIGEYLSIALDNSGIPYVVYNAFGNITFPFLTVKSLTESGWQVIDTSAINVSAFNSLRITIDKCNRALISICANHIPDEGAPVDLLVFILNGSQGWQQVAKTGSRGIPNTPPQISADTDIPIVIDKDGNILLGYTDIEQPYVLRFNGCNWEFLDSIDLQILSSQALFPYLTIKGNKIIYSFIDNLNGLNSGTGQVYEFEYSFRCS